MTYDFIRYMLKMMIQGLKVLVSCCKTYRIGDIMIKNKNTSLYNLDIVPNKIS